MVKKFYILFFVGAIGLILLPKVSNACGSHKACKMSSYPKVENSTKVNHPQAENKRCHKTKIITNKPQEQEQHNCNGKCNHSTCSCSSVSFSFNIPSSIELKINSLVFDIEKRKIFHYKTQLSSGFYSIWLPPVIS